MLADYAAVSEGKLTIVGGGWDYRFPEPAPHAVVAVLTAGWNETGNHSATLVLTDQDGYPMSGPDGQGVRVEATFSIGRVPWAPQGAPSTLPLAVNVGPLPFQAAKRYVWELTVDGTSKPDWQVSFSVIERPAPGAG